MNSSIYIPVYEGAGTIAKGDRVKWCDGLYGTVLGVFKDLVLVETDDGITRMAGESFLELSDEPR